jgi:protein TonB
MFDAVLEKTPSQRRFGVSTVLTVGVHAALVALVTFITTRPPRVVEPDEPAVVFRRPASRPAGALGTPMAATAAKPTTAKRPRPNAILPPRVVPTALPTPVEPPVDTSAGEAVVGVPVGTVGTPDGVPGGDPDAQGPGVPGGSGDALPERDECNPSCAFGVGMTRPVVPAGAFADVYSREAREAQVEGMMIVKCRVQADGAVRDCRVLKGLPHLGDAVLARLATVRATPSYVEGRAVPVDYVFNFSFKLPR